MNEKTDFFGSIDNPMQMSSHFFFGAVEIDYSSAVRASVDKQNYSTFPRSWYIDATFACEDCDALFTWS